MKSLITLFSIGTTAALFLKPAKKPKSKKPKEIPSDAPKINEENIYKYYSKNPIYIKDIPLIFTSLNESLKAYYDPQTEGGIDKAYIYLDPEFASKLWVNLPILFESGFMADTKKSADEVTKKVLIDFAGDVYWKESLDPYIAYSPFWYTWISVNYLTRIAWANYNQIVDVNLAPGSIEE